MGKIKPFDIRSLKPFHREGSHLPGPAPEDEDKIAELDPNLKPEEHSYVGHYIHYADVLLNKDRNAGDEEETPVEEPPENSEAEALRERPPANVVEMPEKVSHSRENDHPEKDGKVA